MGDSDDVGRRTVPSIVGRPSLARRRRDSHGRYARARSADALSSPAQPPLPSLASPSGKSEMTSDSAPLGAESPSMQDITQLRQDLLNLTTLVQSLVAAQPSFSPHKDDQMIPMSALVPPPPSKDEDEVGAPPSTGDASSPPPSKDEDDVGAPPPSLVAVVDNDLVDDIDVKSVSSHSTATSNGSHRTVSSSSSAASGWLRVASEPPVLQNTSDSAVRAFRSKWTMHLHEVGGHDLPYSPLDFLSERVREVVQSRVEIGSLPSNFFTQPLPRDRHLDIIDALMVNKEDTWATALDALRKLQLPMNASHAVWDHGAKGALAWTKALRVARREDDREVATEKVYLDIFTKCFLRHYPVVSEEIKARGGTLKDAYSILASSLRTLEAASRLQRASKPDKPATSKEDTTAPTGTKTNNDGKERRRPVCFVCGLEGHSYHKCTQKVGPWVFDNDVLVNKRDVNLKAKYPRGMADLRKARADGSLKKMSTTVTHERPTSSALIRLGGMTRTTTAVHDSFSDRDIVARNFIDSMQPPPEIKPLPQPETLRLGDNTTTVTYREYVYLDIELSDSSMSCPVRNRIPFRVGPDHSASESPIIISYRTTNDIGAHEVMTKHKRITPIRNSTLPLRCSNGGHFSRIASSSIMSRALQSTAPQTEALPLSDDISESLYGNEPPGMPPVAKRGERPEPMDPPVVHGPQDGVVDIIMKHKHIFSKTLPNEPCSLQPLTLRIKPNITDLPPPARVRRTTPEKKEALEKYVEAFLENGVIQPSQSPTAIAPVLPPKPGSSDGYRFCLDTVPINAITFSQANPIPLIDDLVAACRGVTWFASLDLSHAYFQFALDPRSRYLTAFICHLGLFEFLRVIQGLHASAPHVQAQLRRLFRDCKWLLQYLDDLLITARSREELASRLDVVLARLDQHGFVLNASKCVIGQREIQYLGFMVSGEGSRATDKHVSAILQTAQPTSPRAVRRFLGGLNFLRRFIKDFSLIALPLTELTKKNVTFKWTSECDKAFADLKAAATSNPVLRHFDPSAAMVTVLRCDASKQGIGSVLLQSNDQNVDLLSDDFWPVGYYSAKHTPTEANWPAIEQECAAIFRSVMHWSHLLQGRPFVVQTDHRNLRWMAKSVNAKVQRWFAALLPYQMSIVHLPGDKNATADLLSRSFEVDDTKSERVEDAQIDGVLAKVSDMVEDRMSIIATCHNAIIGHGGVHRTIFLLRMSGHDWVNMEEDVREYINRCDTCNINNPGRMMSHPWGRLQAKELFECFSIDHVGPFPPDAKGNTYLLTCIDDFSRFLEIIPCRDKSSRSVVSALLEIFGRYGCPRQIRADNAKEFESDVLNYLYKTLSTIRIKTVPYSPKSNGIIERSHREINRHLKNVLFDNQHLKPVWTDAVPFVQRIFNASVNRSTNVAPVILAFAGQVSPNRFLLKDVPSQDGKWVTPPEHIARLLLTQSRVLDAVAVAQEKTYAMRDKRKDNPPLVGSPEVGDLVLLSYPVRPPSKLSTRFRGPFKVVGAKGCLIIIASLLVDKVYRVDVSRLKQWNGDADPIEVAQRSEPEVFFPEAILAHEPHVEHPTQASHYLFLTSWEGFEPEDSTWQEMKDIKHLDMFQDYLKMKESSLPPCLAQLIKTV